ncbi:hypothetical protein INR49_016476 [Caranx melampygus]|nr:hypothetical protein INR49_016476 [Caranx melampygus]
MPSSHGGGKEQNRAQPGYLPQARKARGRMPKSSVSQKTSAAGRPRSAMQVATSDSFPPSSRAAGPADTNTFGSTCTTSSIPVPLKRVLTAVPLNCNGDSFKGSTEKKLPPTEQSPTLSSASTQPKHPFKLFYSSVDSKCDTLPQRTERTLACKT